MNRTVTRRNTMSRGAAALALAFVVLATSVTAAGAVAKRPLTLMAISPQVAQRGDLVTVFGLGLGSLRAIVSVAGTSAAVADGTGAWLRFRVPATVPSGAVIVRVTNPGGLTGEIRLTIGGDAFDGNVEVETDEAAATTGEIGADGGSITVRGMTLSVPAGAVPAGTAITLTPLIALVGSPFGAAPVGVKLEPSGLVLLKPATLMLPRPAGVEPSQIATFGFDRDGESFHLTPHLLTADTASMLVWHFSGAGVTTATAEELAQVFGYEPTPAHQLAEMRIARALNTIDAPEFTRELIIIALVEWYNTSVKHGLQIAAGSSNQDVFELAIGEWQAWLASVGLYMAPPVPDVITTAMTEAAQYALSAAAGLAGTLLGQCVASGSPIVALRNVIRLADAVEVVGIPIDSPPFSLPVATDLPSSCMHVELTSAAHAAVLARGRDNRFVAMAEVVFWEGPASTSMPLHFQLGDATDGAPVPIDSGTVSDGRWATTYNPSILGERRLDLVAQLDAALDDDVLRALAGSRRFTVVVRDRLELHAQRPGDPGFADVIGPVAPGAEVSLRIRLAGDNVGGAAISLTNDGSGSVPSTATTDSNGQAIVTYTAPALEGSELVTAAITENGLIAADAIVITTQEPVVVTVSPTAASLAPGQTRQFTATVTGTTDTSVTWSATGGTITTSGLYTAGATLGTFSVRATSVANPAVSAAAAITIGSAAQVTGISRFSNIRAIAAGEASGVGDGDTDHSDQLGAYGGSVTGAISEVISTDFDTAWFETASASSRQASTVQPGTGGAELLSVDFLGSVDATASASAPDVGWAFASAGGRSEMSVRFEVTGGPVAFEVDGSGAVSDTGCLQVRLVRSDGLKVFDFEACGGEDMPLIQASGLLSTGQYLYQVDTGASANDHTGGGGIPAGNATLSAIFVVTQ